VLIFRANEFESSPVLPLAYLLHERKYECTHDDFFRRIAEVLPEIDKAENLIFITDNEAAIRTSIKKNFPSTKVFRCWNHLLQVHFVVIYLYHDPLNGLMSIFYN
jgi:hypothetical protein